MGNRLHHRRICADHFLKNVLGVAGGADAQHLQRRTLLDNLRLELRENLHRVFDGIAFGKLVGLGENAPFLILGNEHRFG